MRLNIDLTESKINRNVFFTSDFHLFHRNILKFDNRPFSTLEEMHEAIRKRWNDVVTDNDIVIYLGDLSFARKEDKPFVGGFVKTLHGDIHYVLGNHDKFDEIKRYPKFKTVSDYLEVKITHLQEQEDKTLKKVDTLFCCMHYPIYSWNKKHFDSIHVHGHTHGNLHHGEDASYYEGKKAIDVGCMLHDYTPITYLNIIDKLKDIPLEKSKNI